MAASFNNGLEIGLNPAERDHHLMFVLRPFNRIFLHFAFFKDDLIVHEERRKRSKARDHIDISENHATTRIESPGPNGSRLSEQRSMISRAEKREGFPCKSASQQ